MCVWSVREYVCMECEGVCVRGVRECVYGVCECVCMRCEGVCVYGV